MKNDFKLLAAGTEVIYNGIRTSIKEDFIARPLEYYMYDIWSYLREKFPDVENTDAEAWDIDPRFERFCYDEFGDTYVVLNRGSMEADEVNWEYDYVFVDTADFCDYERWVADSLKCLSDIDIPQDIHSLTEEQLKKMRSEICAGSCYLSDYNNSMFVDRNVVCAYCDSYLEWIEREKKEDTREEFACYIKETA